MKSISIAALGCGFLVVTLALPAQAQTKPARMVTRDELRICMNSESELTDRRRAMEARSGQNRDEAAAIRAEADEMSAEQKRLEENQAPMEKFSRRVKAHNARVQAAQANSESLRKDLAALNDALTAHNEHCGGISFSTQDREAILKERAPAAN